MIIEENPFGFKLTFPVDGVDTSIKMPSQKFPLGTQPRVFHIENTHQLTDKIIAAAFNSIKYRLGRCYDNMELLQDALINHGILKGRIQTYVGWHFIPQQMPQHHCFIVIDDIYILDYSALRLYDSISQYSGEPKEELRQRVAQYVVEARKSPASEHCAFGQANETSIYIASLSSPKEGIRIYHKLMRAFPNHPSFVELGPDNYSRTQQLIREEEHKHK